MGVTADMTGESKHSATAADGGDSKVREWTNTRRPRAAAQLSIAVWGVGGFNGGQEGHAPSPTALDPQEVPGEAIWRLQNARKPFSAQTLLGELTELPQISNS